MFIGPGPIHESTLFEIKQTQVQCKLLHLNISIVFTQ